MKFYLDLVLTELETNVADDKVVRGVKSVKPIGAEIWAFTYLQIPIRLLFIFTKTAISRLLVVLET